MIQQWLQTKNKNYTEGAELYKQYAGEDNYYRYFKQLENPAPNSPHFQMLLKQLTRLNRINAAKKPVVEPVKKVVNAKDIEVKKLNLNKEQGKPVSKVKDLRKNKKYVNKILTIEWKDLEPRDKEVFFDNQAYFEAKKELLFKNSDSERELKSLHALLKTGNKGKIAEILADADKLEKSQVANWKIIDTWEAPKVVDPVTNAIEETKKKVKQKILLEGYINRAENDLSNPNKNYKPAIRKKKEKKLVDWKKELEILKNEIA